MTLDPMSNHQKRDGNAFEFAVVMAFEAFRTCIGQPTKKHPPVEVLRWMRTMLRAR